MADTKTSALTAATTVDPADLVMTVDVSDTSMAASGTNKKATREQLQTYAAGTLTTDKKVADFSATWNNGAVAFTGVKVAITDTASDAASAIADLQVGGSSKFKVGKDGAVTAAAGVSGTTLTSTVSTGTAPLTVASTTAVTNLNADLLDGNHAAAFVTSASLGTGVGTALAVNTGSAGAFVVNGGALGTPSSGTLTNATGLPVSTGVSGLGTGVATALAVNTGSSGAVVVNGGALGTPSSGTVTNLTGTASININGTVGATTANTGAFTTVSASGVATFSAGTASAPAITTSGDTNNGIYFPAADNVAITTGGTQRVLVDSSGNVGVGVTPSVKFQVKAGTDQQLWVRPGTDLGGANGIGIQSANDAGSASKDLTLYGTAISLLGGNVGIGTSSPDQLATINSAGTTTNSLVSFKQGGTTYAYVGMGSDNRLRLEATSTDVGIQADSAKIIFFNTNGSERMRIDSSGNVGIGTSSPGAKLSVSGSSAWAHINGGNSNTAPIFASLNNETVSSATYGWLWYNNSTNGNLDLYRRNGSTTDAQVLSVERATGNVAIGNTNYNNVRLYVVGSNTTSANFAIYAENSANTVLFSLRNDGVIGTGTAANSPYNLTSGSAANVVVDSTGALYRSTSSLRYKSNVQDATHGLAEVLKLRSVTYNAKNSGDTVFGGLIAEEVHEAGLKEFVAYDNDGQPDALHYGNMVALLTKAIQEQQLQIDALKAEVAALKGNA